MRTISKEQEPIELVWYRSQPGAVYDGCGHELVSRLRSALLSEQGYICAYCMQRITADSMKVEHWHSQSRFPSEQLDYTNLLGCCPGNEGHPPKDQHCDTHKAENDISFNPANCDHRLRMKIRFTGDGTICSEDSLFNEEINTILNLNLKRLKNNRKAVWESVLKALSIRHGTRTRSEVRKFIDRWIRKDEKEYQREYFAVALYLLEKKLRSMDAGGG